VGKHCVEALGCVQHMYKKRGLWAGEWASFLSGRVRCSTDGHSEGPCTVELASMGCIGPGKLLAAYLGHGTPLQRCACLARGWVFMPACVCGAPA